MGHRRIAYLSGPAENVLEHERFRGYREGLEAVQIAFDPDLFIAGDYTIGSGVRAGEHIVGEAQPPTAVFCTSDQMAIGLMRTLVSAGVRVPHDISVAGFDDIDFAGVAEPPLTTIRQPRRELGQAAAAALTALLQNRDTPQRLLLKTELVIRDSVGRR
jgi:LacI family repressor for deo operon, udp, cdd, tsx, nupC, and nupG